MAWQAGAGTRKAFRWFHREGGGVAFSTDELSQDAVRSRTVAFFVGEKIYVLHVFEPVGSGSSLVTTVNMEKRIEAKQAK